MKVTRFSLSLNVDEQISAIVANQAHYAYSLSDHSHVCMANLPSNSLGFLNFHFLDRKP
jgi:hypothetical protein